MLAAKNVKASFFIMGQQLQDAVNVQTLKRAHAEGHFIGSYVLVFPLDTLCLCSS